MAGSAEILLAIRDLANMKQIERSELTELLRDGIHAALAKKHGPTVQAEVAVDEDRGDIRIVLLKSVVDAVEDHGDPPRCVLRGGPCRLNGTCAVHDAFFAATTAMRRELADATLAEIAADAA